MARVNFEQHDIIGDFLPDVMIRRVTLETSGRNEMVINIDLEIEDVLDDAVKNATIKFADRQVGETLSDLENRLDEALKICLVVATSDNGDARVKNLLRRRGQTSTLEQRMAQLHPEGNYDRGIATIKEALEHLALSRLRAPDDPDPGDIRFMSDTARPINGEQYVASTIELLRTYDANNNPIYRLPHSFSVPRLHANTEYFSFYAFTFIDFSIFDIDISDEEMKFLNNLYGKVSYNKVISGGQVNPYARVFLDQNGSVWTGPYHVMQDGGYMSGRFHNNDSALLTPMMVPNLKIQDFRKFKRSELDNYTPGDLPAFLQQDFESNLIRNKRSNQFNARLDIDHEPTTGNVTFEFLIDQEQILSENSKFASLYHNLPNSTKYNVLRPKDYSRLLEVKILRRRVTKRDLGINALGFGAKDVFDKNESPVVIAHTGEPQRARATARSTMQERADLYRSRHVFGEDDIMISSRTERGSVSDEAFEELANSTNNEPFYEWLRSHPRDRVPLPLRTLPFPFYRNIIGSDHSMRNITDGVYQYGIELTYEDGIEKYLTELLANLQRQTKQLESYYNECLIPVTSAKYMSRTGLRAASFDEINPGFRERRVERTQSRGNYNHIKRTFSRDFVDYANDRYNFRGMCLAYFKAINVVYADAGFRIGNVGYGSAGLNVDNVLSLLLPDNSRPEQILEILGSFQELQGLLEDITDVDMIKGAANVQLTPGQAGSSGRSPNLITVQKWFSGVDDFVDATDREAPSMDFLDMVPVSAAETVVNDMMRVARGAAALTPATTAIAAGWAQGQNTVISDSMGASQFSDTGPARQLRRLDEAHTRGAVTTTPARGGWMAGVKAAAQKAAAQKAAAQKAAAQKAAEEFKATAAGWAHGTKEFTPAQLAKRLNKEMAKFDIDISDSQYDSAPASLTFMKFAMPGPSPKEFAFMADTEVPPLMKDEELIITYKTADSKKKASSRSVVNDMSKFHVIDMAIQVAAESKIRSNTGKSKTFSWDAKIENKKRNEKGSREHTIIDKMEKQLRAEILEQESESVLVRDSVKRSYVDKSGFADSKVSLCEEVALEDRQAIEFKEDLSSESPVEFQMTNAAAALTDLVRRSVNKKALGSAARRVRRSKVKEVVAKIPQDKMKFTAMAQGNLIKEAEEKALNIPIQIRKLAEGKGVLGGTAGTAPASLFSTIKKVMKLDGFERDALGRPVLSAPKYKEVTVAEMKAGLGPGKFKLESYESSELGVKALAISKKPTYFKVSAPKNTAPPWTPESESEIAAFKRDRKKQKRAAQPRIKQGSIRPMGQSQSSRVAKKTSSAIRRASIGPASGPARPSIGSSIGPASGPIRRPGKY